jgi:hypothetical protein
VPIGDLVLAQLPAQEDFFVAPKGREINKPLVEILDEQPQLLQLRDAADDLGGLIVDSRL